MRLRITPVGQTPRIERARVAPHAYAPRHWRHYLCHWCYAPRSMHPRTTWVRFRPGNDVTQLFASDPHFKRGTEW